MTTRKLAALCLALATALAAAAPFISQAAETKTTAVKSLRGTDVMAPSLEPDVPKVPNDRGPLPRDFVQQPPLIPHDIQGYQITKNFNKCLDCHSWSRAQETGATKISITHFRDRDGHELAGVSTRRYFCVQCHVPQTDARPLVRNTFQKSTGLQ